jgi:lipopolysaccharide heptosyltransferase I
MKREPPQKNKPNSILIVKLSAIGDVVHSLPLLEVLRKNFPEARIDWLVEEEGSQIIEGHKDLDRVIVSHRKSWQKRFLRVNQKAAVLKEIREFIGSLRTLQYDLVIDLQGLFKSGLLTGLSRGRRKIGFTGGGKEGSYLFLTERPHFFDYDKHALDRYLAAAESLSCTINSFKGEIPIRPIDKERVDRLLRHHSLDQEVMVAINPVARWATKLWDEQNYAPLADKLQRELSCKVLFTGSKGDRPLIARIVERMETHPLNLAGEVNLKELAYLYTRCRLVISTDTGPMHIAAAMNTPVVALFGPTAPWRTGPYGRAHRVIREELSCSPCFKKKCSHRSCMSSITVDRVFGTAKESIS